MRQILLHVVIFALSTGSVVAHESRPAYLELQQTSDDGYNVLWKVPARGPNMRLGLHVRLPVDCKIVEPARTRFIGGAIVERSKISRTGGLTGTEIYIEGLSTTLTDVLVRIGRLDGSTQVVLLTPSAPSFVVDSAPTFTGVAKTYLVLGVQHIWNGIDHLLFVVCLILIAGTWRRILITITGFTIAHSITLALAALNLVRVSIPPVEATIALSIVFLATEIARKRRDTLTWRFPISVSASFGLLHGFGFASALGEIGLPQTEIPAALLFFNLGIEVGQVVFVSAIIGLVWVITILQRSIMPTQGDWLRWIERPLAYTVGTLAMYWTAERVMSFWS